MYDYDEATDYWRTNEAWYEETGSDINGETIFKLTDQAPKKARESFEKYQADPIHTCLDENNAQAWIEAGHDDVEGFKAWKAAGYPELQEYLAQQ